MDYDNFNGEDDEAGAADGEDEPAEEMEGDAEARTRAQLQKLWSGRSPNDMVLSFLKNRSLQKQALIIVYVTQPIEDEYNRDLEAMKGGCDTQGHWCAERTRACSHWLQTCQRIMDVVQGPTLARRLRFRRFTDAVSLDAGHEWLAEEQKLAQQTWDFAAECVAGHVQANLPHIMCLPEAFAAFLLKDMDKRSEEVARLRELTLAVYDAEQRIRSAASDDAVAASLLRLFEQLGWAHFQVPREMMALLLRSDFSARDSTCVRLAAKLFKGPACTKHCLEDTFSHLQRVVSMQGHNKKMSDWAKFFYCSTCPYVTERQLLPSADHWRAYVGDGVHVPTTKEIAEMFDTRMTELPEPEDDEVLIPEPGQMLKTFRAAGPLANQRSAAAAALLVFERPHGFRHVEDAWAGHGLFVVRTKGSTCSRNRVATRTGRGPGRAAQICTRCGRRLPRHGWGGVGWGGVGWGGVGGVGWGGVGWGGGVGVGRVES